MDSFPLFSSGLRMSDNIIWGADKDMADSVQKFISQIVCIYVKINYSYT